MEYKNTCNNLCNGDHIHVLILVLMEYKNTINRKYLRKCISSLNPCSNGIQKYKTDNFRKR